MYRDPKEESPLSNVFSKTKRKEGNITIIILNVKK